MAVRRDGPALIKGLWHAHMGWLFDVEQTPQRQYAPDLLNDRDIVRVSRAFCRSPWRRSLLPPVLGGLMTWSWHGALTAFFWAGLVRVALLHHVTWSINSICHAMGERPFESRDRSGNVWWLAVLSMGESWHNLHHADPTCARHGVLAGQVDSGARLIRLFESLRLGVRRPLAASRSASTPAGRPAWRPESDEPSGAGKARRDGRAARMTGKQRREQLLDVGRSLFAERGFDATSVEEIAAKAGVSKPVVYEHFGGKEGLYAVVVDREMSALLDAITGALTSSGRPRELLEQAAFALLDYIEHLHRRLPHPGARLAGGDSRPAASRRSSATSASQVEHIMGNQLKSRGFDPKLAPMYAQMLVGMVALTGQWWLDARKPAKPEVAAHLVNLAWNGLSGLECQARAQRRAGARGLTHAASGSRSSIRLPCGSAT